MLRDVECTHCRVIMTSWAAPGSPVRYWQCPFCGRTHSSLYSEVFERGAGARRVEAALVESPRAPGPPQPSPEDIRWARLKARAARWFARLEREQLLVEAPAQHAPGARSCSPAMDVQVVARGGRPAERVGLASRSDLGR